MLANKLPPKFQWKKQIMSVIAEKWNNIFKNEMKEKVTLQFCNKEEVGINKTHPVLDTLPSVTYEVKKHR